MKIEDLITLSKAGFTKDEILQLVSSSSVQPTPEKQEAAPAAPAAPQEEAKEEKKDAAEDISKVIEQKIGEAFKPFENLYNNIAAKANMPTIGSVEPRGVEDIINDFFTK